MCVGDTVCVWRGVTLCVCVYVCMWVTLCVCGGVYTVLLVNIVDLHIFGKWLYNRSEFHEIKFANVCCIHMCAAFHHQILRKIFSWTLEIRENECSRN